MFSRSVMFIISITAWAHCPCLSHSNDFIRGVIISYACCVGCTKVVVQLWAVLHCIATYVILPRPVVVCQWQEASRKNEICIPQSQSQPHCSTKRPLTIILRRQHSSREKYACLILPAQHIVFAFFTLNSQIFTCKRQVFHFHCQLAEKSAPHSSMVHPSISTCDFSPTHSSI